MIKQWAGFREASGVRNHEAAAVDSLRGKGASGQEQEPPVRDTVSPGSLALFPPPLSAPMGGATGRPGGGNVDAVYTGQPPGTGQGAEGRGGSRGASGDARADMEQMSEAGIQGVH